MQNINDIISEYHARLSSIMYKRKAKALEKHNSKSKYFVRDRIDLLLDEDSSFLELSSFGAYDKYNNDFPSAGIITGIGKINRRLCMIVANDATVKAGCYVEETVKKHIRAQEIAMKCNLICVYLVDSGGVYLPQQSRVFPDRFNFGRIFYNQALMSSKGIAQIAIVMGLSTAGGAYIPAMCDQNIMVRNQSSIFLAGPALVKAATGEEVSAEDLGGAEMHTSKSGVADHIADDENQAIEICKKLISEIPLRNKRKNKHSNINRIEEIYNFAPVNYRNTVNIKKLVKLLVDNSKFTEFKENYGKTILTAFGKINNKPIGIIANNGIIFSDTALKATHFIQICCKKKIPILFIQNITGFMVGKKYEHNGIAKHGAKLVNAVANAKVPKISLVIGASFGAGNYAMCGRAYDPDFLFTWPTAKIGVMGSQQAANVMSTVRNLSDSEYNEIITEYESKSNAYYSSSNLWDDGIIDPADTRIVISMALECVHNRKIKKSRFGVFRM
ncbi:MAG: methylcrotonoyl-CoA carboxylase [Marinifilaceae bacterium]|jgi:3-methylcrotonyl-CoA carboxylase beta subunit|nr:methylcrotonoyl-CoA carboxylase [Marinifilaceae bacterium]